MQFLCIVTCFCEDGNIQLEDSVTFIENSSASNVYNELPVNSRILGRRYSSRYIPTTVGDLQCSN